MCKSMKSTFVKAAKALAPAGLKVKRYAKAVTIGGRSTDYATTRWMRLAVKGHKEVSVLVLQEVVGLVITHTAYLERGSSGLDMRLDEQDGPSTKELKRFATG